MNSSRFTFANFKAYRQFLIGTQSDQLVTLLNDRSHILDRGMEQFPFVLANNLFGKPEIHPMRYLKKVYSQQPIGITQTDAILLSYYAKVPMRTPFSMGVEAATMAMVFGVILPLLEEHGVINEDPARIFALLLIGCLILYPVSYKLASLTWTKKNPAQRSLIMYSYDDLMIEGFRLFTILVCALIGLDLANAPLNKAILGTGIAAPLAAIFGKFSSLTEWNTVVVLSLLRDLLHTAAIFMPLMYIINSLDSWVPQDLDHRSTYLSVISPATVIVGLPLLGKSVGFLEELLTKGYTAITNCIPQCQIPHGYAAVPADSEA